MSWLNELKVGDEVAVTSRHGARICKAERVTPTQIVAGGLRFRRDGGRLVGASAWDDTSLEPATPELRDSLRLERVKMAVRSKIAARNNELTVAQWDRIAAILAEKEPDEHLQAN